ncbi:MAG: hypothetical protein AAFZ05_15240, partial [Pseudomonadota bacterium]
MQRIRPNAQPAKASDIKRASAKPRDASDPFADVFGPARAEKQSAKTGTDVQGEAVQKRDPRDGDYQRAWTRDPKLLSKNPPLTGEAAAEAEPRTVLRPASEPNTFAARSPALKASNTSPRFVTVLLKMKPGARGIRRFNKTADP